MTHAGKTPETVSANNQKGESGMSHYRHLGIEEREKRYLMAERGETLRQIAGELNRAVSTISREFKRNKAAKYPYSPSGAQRSYEKRESSANESTFSAARRSESTFAI